MSWLKVNKRASWQRKNRKYIPKKGTARTKAYHLWELPVNETDLDGLGVQCCRKTDFREKQTPECKEFYMLKTLNFVSWITGILW